MPRPARPWFRFHSEALESLKVHNLPDRLVKPWLFLMCLANINEPRGRLPAMSKVAFALRVKEEKAKAIVAALLNAGFIDFDNERYVLHDWDDWQKASDANETPARRDRNEVKNADRTPKERAKNALRTPKEQEKNAVRTHREEESREDQNRVEEEEEPETPRRNIFGLYQDSFSHPWSPIERERMLEMEQEYPADCIEHAFREAAELNKRSLRYVDTICQRHKEKGNCYDDRAANRLAETAGLASPAGIGFSKRVNVDD